MKHLELFELLKPNPIDTQCKHEEFQVCVRCGIKKPINDFKTSTRPSQNGRHKTCIKCEESRTTNHLRYHCTPEYREKSRNWCKKYDYVRRYGITLEEFTRIAENQEYKCEICGVTFGTGDAKMCADHDHSLGIFRGVICRGCNTAIGKLKNHEMVTTLSMYMKKHNITNG